MTREEAIDYIREWCPYDRQEEIIKALEQEPCSDAISRQAVNDAITDVIVKYIPILYGNYEKIPLELITAISQLPPVNPRPKTGHWIKSKDGYMRCDKCGSRGSAIKARFCHHCGARMVEPQESEDKE